MIGYQSEFATPDCFRRPFRVRLLPEIHLAKQKRRGFPRRLVFFALIFDQRSSWSTLCCDWLASASAETAIDWRVDSAWLLAASWFGSASVRFDAPVCRTLIRFLLKS